MTTLADVQVGDQFLFACQCTSIDPTAGMGLALYGPNRVQAASAAIAPSGAMTGQLATAPASVPVDLITGYAPVGVGDVLVSNATGETMVARWSQVRGDGTSVWSASASPAVVYPAEGWTVIAHVSL